MEDSKGYRTACSWSLLRPRLDLLGTIVQASNDPIQGKDPCLKL